MEKEDEHLPSRRQEQEAFLRQWRQDHPPLEDDYTEQSLDEESHVMAIEACLLSFKVHLENMPKAEKVVRKMRKKTRRRVKGKFTEESKTTAAAGLTARKRYWHEYYAQLDDSYTRLVGQLQLTEADFPELADNSREHLIAIIQSCNIKRKPSKYHKAPAIMESWNVLVQQLETALSSKERIFPQIEHKLATVRNRIEIAMQTQ